MGETMTKAERDALLMLIKKREKVMKAAVAQQSSENLAEFERQIATIYECDDDEVWREAATEADEAVQAAQEKIAARCDQLGIPKDCRPMLSLSWHGRGRTVLEERRNELRRVAKARIEANAKAASTKVEEFSLDAQAKILAHGLTSDAAKAFLEQMPSAKDLMPLPDPLELKALVDARVSRRRRMWDEPGMLN